MFYSHEVLTSHQYGIATVWYVATLGSDSKHKEVTRKKILEVDVPKACETIVTPEVPMALRLQSSLLCGVTRVYARQCGYVLRDAEQAKNNMRMLVKSMRASDLDAEGATKARDDQLMLQDDPNFLPDFNLMNMELDRVDFDMSTKDNSQHSTLSPHNSQLTDSGLGSQQDIGGLMIPESASSFIGGPVGGVGYFSVRGDSSAGGRIDAPGLYEDDLRLDFADDGNFRSNSPAAPHQAPGPSARSNHTDPGSVGARALHEHAGSIGAGTVLDQHDDDGFVMFQDDDAAPIPASGALPARVVQQVTSEETAEAPMRRRKPTKKRAVQLDSTMELHNRVLAGWVENYVVNMNDAIHHKNVLHNNALGKKNAEYWMLEQGCSGPLDIFSGARLLNALTDIKLSMAGSKRPRDDGDESDASAAKRSRSDPSSDEVGRGFFQDQDDGYMPMIGDEDIEQGREAPTPLDEDHVSSLMPWNQSAGSRRPTGLFSARDRPSSASAGGLLPGLPYRGSRLTSASPSLGRGINDGNIDDFQLDIDMSGDDAFETFGPAAQVDTQTAQESQWVRSVLDGESGHFLEFVQTGIEEMDLARDEAEPGDEEDEIVKGSVEFEALLPPLSHSRIVAAQALLHVLALATKNMLSVEQIEAFGAIIMRVIGGGGF